MLLNAALKEYLLECELRNYTEKTIKGYRNSIELLVNYLQQNGITRKRLKGIAIRLNCWSTTYSKMELPM